MKRRTFLKRSSIGLGAAVAGVAGAGRILAGDGTRGRIYGIPDSVRPRPVLEHNLARLSLARTDIPPEAWQDVVALSLLAQDVFDNPDVARAFSRDPRGYLQTIGLDDVRLDPQAAEVKVALALGDPDVHDAVERGDPKAFLRAIEVRGLLSSPDPSQIAARLTAQLASPAGRPGPTVSPEGCTVVIVCAAVAFVVVAVAAAAVVAIYVYAFIYTAASGPKKMQTGLGVLRGSPSFRVAAALGGEEFGGRAADSWLEENVEKVAQAVEDLETWSRKPPIGPEPLRALVRAQMVRMLGGDPAVVEAVKP
jgi:hypothetical protein